MPPTASAPQNETGKTLRVVYGSCPHDCPDCCALETQGNEQGWAVSVRGRSDHPDRPRYPVRRVGWTGLLQMAWPTLAAAAHFTPTWSPGLGRGRISDQRTERGLVPSLVH